MNADEANATIDAARRLQRARYRAAKASPERRFHALYDTVSRADILERAWGEVYANGGAAGVDGQTIGDVERRGDGGSVAASDAMDRAALERLSRDELIELVIRLTEMIAVGAGWWTPRARRSSTGATTRSSWT